MYVITDHNNQNFVILGPIAWKPRYISDILSDELDYSIVVTKEDEFRVPFEPAIGVKIRRCDSTYEDINPKTERHDGPYWTYDDSNSSIQAIAVWKRADKPIDLVKSELKNHVAAQRWAKESAGISITIQDVEVWCDTSRGNRDIFLQKYALMTDGDSIKWKFPNSWLTLTKAELGLIVSKGGEYIQSCFDWEAACVERIEACTSLTELAALEFEDING
jgi:hypothetical protein